VSGAPAAVPELVQALIARGETLAVAESLTGGALAAALVDVPGVSGAFRGGIVAYATEVKHALLGVDAGLLAREGAVHPEVARQMADGVRRALGTTWGVATTGVAGPDPQDGRPPGRVFVAVTGPSTSLVEPLELDGNRAAVRAATVDVALDLLARALEGSVQPRA
jgi:nicotinamide-nucleotide amidase